MKNLNKTFLALALSFTFILVQAQAQSLAWGDQGNGTYVNPVLNVDYSDPDVIRVGEKYYMVASDFNYMGMQVMESDDMVNWKYISQVYDHFDVEGWDEMKHYAGGCWAPALVEHNGRYYVYFCTPDEGLFMSSATNPRGPWTPLHCVKSIKGWEDPCPFWDEDGQAYLGHSRVGAGPIIIHKMSADGKQLLDDGLTVYTGPVAEGTKFLKHEGYYFLIIPEGGVGTGWQTALRSKNIYGPYETKIVMAQGKSPVNGPHQGGWVDTPSGEDWFMHFQDVGAYGRIVHLQPMKWVKDWPVIGVDKDGDGCGDPVLTYKKPNVGKSYPICTPQESDEFDHVELMPQWQWQADGNMKWSFCNAAKGVLRLYSYPVAKDYKNLWDVNNLLLQKPTAPNFTATMKTTFVPSEKYKGERTGLVVLGMDYAALVVENTNEGLVLSQVECLKADKGSAESVNGSVKLKNGTVKKWQSLGKEFQAREGKWIGCKTGTFCTRPAITTNDGGWADVDWFRVSK